jgi:hypothetical protein
MNIKIDSHYLTMPRAALLRAIRAETGLAIRSLLAKPTSNPKLAKNLKLRVLSFPLHLAPARLGAPDGKPRATVCPKATAGCESACLNTAGNPAYARGKRAARRARTLLFWQRKDLFFALLMIEIRAAAKQARAKRMRAAFRLNATSDIQYERFQINGRPFIASVFSRLTFYDYTKIPNRQTPPNYSLVFSVAETTSNQRHARAELAAGRNVAAVFDTKRNRPLPTTLWGYSVTDGDEHDFIVVDVPGTVRGLRAKGSAIGDASGFVLAA